MKRSRRVEDLLDLKPVTDEEFEELLDDKPKKNNKGSRKKKKSKFEEFF